MVWIHGGYLHMLSGQERGYSPTEELAGPHADGVRQSELQAQCFRFMALEVLREGSPTNSSGKARTCPVHSGLLSISLALSLSLQHTEIDQMS